MKEGNTMEGLPLVSCLMATHGRFREVCGAVVDFLQQDYPERELIILNNHPMPLAMPEGMEDSRVRIINEPGHPTLGDCRIRLLQEAKGEFVRTWDDDDVYLPWTISQGVAHIGNEIAFKPRHSWFDCENGGVRLEDNVFEAAMLTRADFVREHSYQPTAGDEHHTLVQAIEERGLKRREFGVWASYVYRWGYGVHHISGTMGSGTVEDRTAAWKAANNDTGEDFGGVLNLPWAMQERVNLFHRMAPFAGTVRNEWFSRAAGEFPPESVAAPDGVIHELATKDLVKPDQKFCAMEFGRNARGSTREILDDSRVGLLISVDPGNESFEAVKASLSMDDMPRIHMLADLGDCSPCAMKCNPNYLTLNTGDAMENLQSLLAVMGSLAPNARITVKAADGFLVRSALDPTHRTILLGDYYLFYARYVPEWLHWPPAVARRVAAE